MVLKNTGKYLYMRAHVCVCMCVDLRFAFESLDSFAVQELQPFGPCANIYMVTSQVPYIIT